MAIPSHVVILQETAYNPTADAITTVSTQVHRGTREECEAWIAARLDLPPEENTLPDGWLRVMDADEWQMRLNLADAEGDSVDDD